MRALLAIILALPLAASAQMLMPIVGQQAASAPASPITVVNGPTTNNNASGSTTLDLTLNSGVANNALAIAGNIYGDSTCTDFIAANTVGTGTVTRLGISGTVAAAMGQSAVWSVEGISAGNHTVRLTASGCAGNVYISGVIIQIDNVPVSGVADQFNSGTGASGTSFSAGNITTTTDNYFGLAICGASAAQTWTRGTGWTNDGNTDAGGYIHYEYRIGTSAATITGDLTGTANAAWTCAVGDIKGNS